MQILLSTLILFLNSPPLAETTPHQMPKIIRASGGGPLLWIEAKSILTATGDVDEQLIGPVAAKSIRSLLASEPAHGCIQVGAILSSGVNAPRRSTLEAAVDTANVVIEGRVTSRSFGFHGMIPGQLLRVSTGEIIKDRHSWSTGRESFYVFVPVGDFAVGKYRICKSDPSYGSAPDLGDRVIAFGIRPGAEDFLDTWDESGLVTLKPDGSIRLPPNYRSSSLPAGLTHADLIHFIRREALRQSTEQW